MKNPIIIFLLRAAVGSLGGWGLTYFFFTPKGQPLRWFIIVVLGGLVVAAAYISEAWRQRKQDK
ncbi:AtpZ/AtpI family protein [Desulfarculales bacterium]